MDHSELYQYRFDELLRIVKKGKSVRDSDDKDDKQIIDVCGNEFREYQRIVSYNESWALYTLRKVIIGLFDSEGINYNINLRSSLPYIFTLKEEKGIIAYFLMFKLEKGLIEMREIFNKYKGIDGAKIIFLQNNYQKEINLFNEIEMSEDNSFIECYTLKDFFDEHLGVDEFPVFMEYVEKFNERAKNLIGHKVAAIPTSDAIREFRHKKAEMLKGEDYESSLPASVDSNQGRQIIDNYIHQERYRIMTGQSDFADSFIASEWYYGIHMVTGAIDETGLVTGYLKSIEQLLYTLICLSIQNGEIKVDQTTPLGSLIHIVKKKDKIGHFINADLFDVDSSTIQSIIDELYPFLELERNVYLHKTNLYTREGIDDIRARAILLYCLLLGGFRIESVNIEKLSSDDTVQTIPELIGEEELQKIIIEWASPILLFDLPKESYTVAFFVNKFSGMDWELCLQGLEKIPKEEYKSIKWNHRQHYSSSYTRNCITWKSDGDYHVEYEKIKNVLKKIVNCECEVANLLKQFNEVVVGDRNGAEVLLSNKQSDS